MRNHVRRHVTEADPHVRISCCTRRIDIGHDIHGKRGRANHARHARNDRNRDRDHQIDIDAVHHGLAKCCDDDESKHDDREREQDIDEALNPVVYPSAKIGGGDAENGADRGAHQGRCKSDHQRRARSVNDPRENIAAKGIRTQPVIPGRRGKNGGKIDAERVVGSHQLRKQPGKHHDRDHDEAHRAHRLLPDERQDRIGPLGQHKRICRYDLGRVCHQLPYRMRGSNTA